MKIDYNTAWYKDLVKPDFQPPDWIFGPVWTVLYILMFISLALIIRENFTIKSVFAYALFALQLVLNLSWSPLFFGHHQIKEALIVCILLTLTVFLMFFVFYSISKLSAFLLLPYLVWVSFATVLNFAIMKLN